MKEKEASIEFLKYLISLLEDSERVESDYKITLGKTDQYDLKDGGIETVSTGQLYGKFEFDCYIPNLDKRN